MKCTNYKAAGFEIFSTLLLLPLLGPQHSHQHTVRVRDQIPDQYKRTGKTFFARCAYSERIMEMSCLSILMFHPRNYTHLISIKLGVWDLCQKLMSRHSSVGLATGYGLDDRMIGVRFPAGAGNVFLRHHVQTGSGAHSASYPMGTECFSPGIKRPGREAEY
jgi:hypothetical protein